MPVGEMRGGIHGAGWDYDFPDVNPANVDRGALDAHNAPVFDAEMGYLWMHMFVQPGVALLTTGAAAGAAYDGAQLSLVRWRYRKALEPLVESMSVGISQVYKALKAAPESSAPTIS
jgi:hypothetical protein